MDEPWPDDVNSVLRGDLTAAVSYVTPAGGAVVTAVAPCGLADTARGTVGFTTSLGFGTKLERIVREPKVAMAYHSREHGLSDAAPYVLVQGVATVELTPSLERLEAFVPQAERHMGAVVRGPLWDRLLREYYRERLFVDVDVERVVAWPTLTAAGKPRTLGRRRPGPPPPQDPPRGGVGPRLDVQRTAERLSGLTHRLLAYRGADGFPVIVPVHFGPHDDGGLRLICETPLPAGGRRAGLLAHSYRPQLIGLSTRVLTGWLEVDEKGARYAPHTSRGFVAPPSKQLLLVSNGLFAKVGLWRARRSRLVERLQSPAAQP